MTPDQKQPVTTGEHFARAALDQLPRILTLQDRNPHSPTYGCFDRNFWHYKIIDFPSGMAQEFVWPLALAYRTDLAGNPFFAQPNILEWVQAGIQFARKSAHADGSCDDYYPHERAAGAAAFSLLAFLESWSLLDLNLPDTLPFIERRADWLARHEEAGQLSNHEALIALSLFLAGQLLNTGRWRERATERLNRVLGWQSKEGWFQEYEGCDPGYHTLTLWCLARLYELHPSDSLRDSIALAVSVAAEFIHPDGSYGGEYGSRNTHVFFPAGFELAGRWMPEALSVNDLYVSGLTAGLAPCWSDDHILGHATWNFLLAHLHHVGERSPRTPRTPGRLFLREAGILIDRRQDRELYIAVNKGGVFKLFQSKRLIASDTQFSVIVKKGSSLKNAVAHLVDGYGVRESPESLEIEGVLGWAKQTQMSTIKLLCLRLVMSCGGRFFPNAVRRILQRLLITDKRPAPFRFKRSITWESQALRVVDELHADSWKDLHSVKLGCDQTSIHVAMSRTFQAGQLQQWLDLTPRIRELRPGEPLRIERNL